MLKPKRKKATRVSKTRKLKVKKVLSEHKQHVTILEEVALSRLPRWSALIKNPPELEKLFDDIRRAQKVSGKEIIIIWLR